MAKIFDDCEFWLPPHFLTDDLTLLNNKPQNDVVFDAVLKARFPYLSSPAESVIGSNETESDEEDLMAELTHRMTHSSLQLDFPSENQKIVFGSFSPQSTLCTMESSGKGSSPNGSVSSQANTQKATIDLLRAAAGEVERMKLLEEEKASGVLRNTVKPSPIGPAFYAQQQQQQYSLFHPQSQIAQFEMLRRQQLATQQQGDLMWGYSGSNNYNYNSQMVPNRGRNDTVLQGLSSSAWPTLQHTKQQPQQQYGGAVIVGNAGVKKERNGTGVFLPRVYDVPSESRKKPAVVPEKKVAQASNPKVQGVVKASSPQHNKKNRFNGTSNMENGPAVAKNRSENGFSGQKHNLRQQPPPPPPVDHEIQLPKEWAY